MARRSTLTLGGRERRDAFRALPPLESRVLAPQRRQPTAPPEGDHLGLLARPGLRVEPDTICTDVYKLFREHCDEGSVLVPLSPSRSAIVIRHRFMQTMSGHYGWSVYHRRPITMLLEDQPLVLSQYLTPSEASTAILQRDQDHRYDDVLVTEHSGQPVGVLSVAMLLEHLSSQRELEASGALRALEAERDRAEALRTREGFLHAIVANAPMVLLAVDAFGVITLAEGHGLGAFGLSPGQTVGQPVAKLYGDVPQVVEDIDRALLGDHVTSVVQAAGRVFETVYAPLRDPFGGVTSVLAVATDVTAYTRAAQDLREALDRERTTSGQLRMLDEARGTFLQAVSHDVRTPLTTVMGAALTLERAGDRLTEADRKDLLARLVKGARKLDRLVNDLLDLDRLTADPSGVRREPTDLGELVLQVAEESNLAAQHPLYVDAQRVVVGVDRPKVERIVENLLNNAAKYTSPETPVWVRVVRADGGALLLIEDAGPGIPEEIRAAIFEPFSRGDNGSVHGTGVGLALVARFAELHGGDAWVEDRPGGGASFRVYLPDPDAPVAAGL